MAKRVKAQTARPQLAATVTDNGRIRREATDGTGQVFSYSFRRQTAREANVLLGENTQFLSTDFVAAVSLQIDGVSDPLDASADTVTAAGMDIVDFTLTAGRLKQLTAKPRTKPGF